MSWKDIPESFLQARDLVIATVDDEDYNSTEYVLHGTTHDMVHFLGHQRKAESIIIRDFAFFTVLTLEDGALGPWMDLNVKDDIAARLPALLDGSQEPEEIPYYPLKDFEKAMEHLDVSLDPGLLQQPERLACAVFKQRDEADTVIFFESTPDNAAQLSVSHSSTYLGQTCDIYTMDGELLLSHNRSPAENKLYREAADNLMGDYLNNHARTIKVPYMTEAELCERGQENWLRQRRGRLQTIDDYCVYKATCSQAFHDLVMAEAPDEGEILAAMQADYDKQMLHFPLQAELYNDDKGFHLDRCVQELQRLDEQYIRAAKGPEM